MEGMIIVDQKISKIKYRTEFTNDRIEKVESNLSTIKDRS